ncbi:MAG TPA: hydrolase TatD, partial [Bacteroidetes bacterium]|nr:hydrolase TatD [Bacteroidota bacterium]
LDRIVKSIPLNFLLLETDSPFLSPEPYRGKRNQSAYLTFIAQKLAEIKQKPFETIAENTSNNALKLFHLNRKQRNG